MTARRFHRRTQWPAWLAVIGFVLHALVPLGQALPRAWIVGSDGTALPLILCSALGDVSHKQHPAGHDATRLNCPICQVLQAGTLALPTEPVVLAGPAVHRYVLVVPKGGPGPSGISLLSSFPRGPPAVA